MTPAANDLGSGARAAVANLRSIAGDLQSARLQSGRHQPSPPLDGLVVEVGGGQRPQPRADIVVDKYVYDDTERAGETQLDTSRPLVVADGQYLPFADDSVDYVIAMHVLEHATDPERFAAELSRVAPRGFVQVPSREAELTFGWKFHPWLIDLAGGKLVFRPKGELNAPCGDLFHSEFNRSSTMRLWWMSRLDLWLHSVEWQGELAVEASAHERAEVTAQFDPEQTIAALRSLSDRNGARGPAGSARDALRCPLCRGALRWEHGTTACVDCARAFPVVGSVPVLVIEAAQ